MKEVEAGMRYLIDSYITAGETKVLTTFDDQTLLDLLCTDIEQFKESLPQRIKESNEAMAETIENNVRKLIVDESEMNPKYFEKMSVLLDELVELRKQKAIEYEEYLKQIVDLVDKVKEPL
jgi:type I restriction enzyme R subunit